MKKILFPTLAVIATISAVCYSNQNSSKKMSPLTMANIEALTRNENSGYEVVREMYDYVITEYPDGTVIQDWVYLGKDCSGHGHLPC